MHIILPLVVEYQITRLMDDCEKALISQLEIQEQKSDPDGDKIIEILFRAQQYSLPNLLSHAIDAAAKLPRHHLDEPHEFRIDKEVLARVWKSRIDFLEKSQADQSNVLQKQVQENNQLKKKIETLTEEKKTIRRILDEITSTEDVRSVSAMGCNVHWKDYNVKEDCVMCQQRLVKFVIDKAKSLLHWTARIEWPNRD